MDVILCLPEHLSVCDTKEPTAGSLAGHLDLNDEGFHSNLCFLVSFSQEQQPEGPDAPPCVIGGPCPRNLTDYGAITGHTLTIKGDISCVGAAPLLGSGDPGCYGAVGCSDVPLHIYILHTSSINISSATGLGDCC